jgi:hypothetical protein
LDGAALIPKKSSQPGVVKHFPSENRAPEAEFRSRAGSAEVADVEVEA